MSKSVLRPSSDATGPGVSAGVADAHPDPSALLEATFVRIHDTRMAGLPFLNPALRVEAVGFRRWEGLWLGVLITPWFMNLMLLPCAAVEHAWPHVRYGESLAYRLPAGVFEFIRAQEPPLGDYQSCSLFSPMAVFADQAGARATAVAALAALFDEGTRAGAEGPGTSLAGPAASPVAAPSATSAPPSRRDFLRGRWQGETLAGSEPPSAA
jgi:[NiFe] hydrogenase assembly HybE family chaperone